MSWLLGGIAFLILGYFTYGRLVEWIVGPVIGVLFSLAFAAYAVCRGRNPR